MSTYIYMYSYETINIAAFNFLSSFDFNIIWSSLQRKYRPTRVQFCYGYTLPSYFKITRFLVQTLDYHYDNPPIQSLAQIILHFSGHFPSWPIGSFPIGPCRASALDPVELPHWTLSSFRIGPHSQDGSAFIRIRRRQTHFQRPLRTVKMCFVFGFCWFRWWAES